MNAKWPTIWIDCMCQDHQPSWSCWRNGFGDINSELTKQRNNGKNENQQNYIPPKALRVYTVYVKMGTAFALRFGKWFFAGIAGNAKRNVLLPIDNNKKAPLLRDEQGRFFVSSSLQKDKSPQFCKIGYAVKNGLKKTKVVLFPNLVFRWFSGWKRQKPRKKFYVYLFTAGSHEWLPYSGTIHFQ